jgi:hypothetical protein
VSTTGGVPDIEIVVGFAGQVKIIDDPAGTVRFRTAGLEYGRLYPIEATASDGAGDEATDTVEVVIAPPELAVSIDDPEPGDTVGGTFPVTVSTTGGVAPIGIDVTFADQVEHIDGPGGTVEFTTAGLNNGDIRIIEITATDSVGQTDSASVGVVVLHPPLTVFIDSPEDQASVHGLFDVQVNATGGVPDIGIDVTFAGTTEHIDGSAGTVQFDTAGLVEGDKYPIEATASDSVGQIATDTIDVVVEDVPFSVTVVSPLPDPIQTVDGLFEVEVETTGGAPEITIDVTFVGLTETIHGSAGVVTFHAGYAPLEGNWPIEVWATDGNGETVWTNTVVNVDLSGPPPPMLVIINSPHDGQEVSEGMPVIAQVLAGEDPVEVEVTFGHLSETIPSRFVEAFFDTTLLENGSHELTVLATDAVGETASETITLIVNNSE